jgi:glycosyltransferase involved in cell wall biosynthesis
VSGVDAVGVVIPACNEETDIDRCLHGVQRARRRCPVPVVTLVVLDSCTDSTAARVAAHPGVETLVVSEASVGAARRAGVDWVLSSLGMAPSRVWLAHTDADSVPPTGWLSYMVAAARGGADLILGTVVPDVADSKLLQAWRALHPVRTGHPHVHGANLGVRASVYLAAGGFPPVNTGEDVALAARASALVPGSTVRTTAIAVRTSGRRVGRAPLGFAGYLDGLDADRLDTDRLDTDRQDLAG